LNTGSWVSIFMPLFVIIFIIVLEQRAAHKAVLLRIRKRKGVVEMTNELIQKCIGKKCMISTWIFGTNVKGIIIGG